MVILIKKITVLIQDKTLIFKYRTNKPVDENLLNTNVISNNELVFSDEYLKENNKIVALFMSDLAKIREIKEINASSNEIALLIMDIIAKLNKIDCLTIMQDENLSYALCEAIIKAKCIKKVSCYGIPQFMIEMLDKNNIKVESRNEVLFTSNFMAENNLTSFSKIYYKTNIKIPDVLTAEDYSDIEIFCNINKYLKVIHFDKYSDENIINITNILKDSKRKNILIQLHDDLEDEKAIMTLKNLNRELKHKYKIKISLIYSNDYLEKNYLQQVIFTTLRICAIIIFLITSSVLGYIIYNNYSSELKVNHIKENIKEVLENASVDKEIATNDNEESFVPGSYNLLLDINDEIVGWLSVPGTNIDYPIVQTDNNDYYLEHNLYGEEDFNGWLFMDYRDDAKDLSDNTIIFGHNRFSSGVMFGTLHKLQEQERYEDEANRYITFNTMEKGYRWEIFSVYTIKVTNDYLYSSFANDEDRQEFYNKLAKRSEIDFGVELTSQDKIITLSTCLKTDKRLVVHAVLKEETTIQKQEE